ncbi:hypothetical protein [Bacillus pumilus]|uniref:hypothetical protein n=1 Tax=Bacillus pumilus TaxID=1408 RepID=UPI0011A10798|nr:hypothetical protein [Bacillus pumilus]
MQVIKNVELDGHRLLIDLHADKISNGWYVSECYARDMKTSTVVFRQLRGSIAHYIDRTLKEIIIETAKDAVKNIIDKTKDDEEIQELKNWDGLINS